MGRVDARNFEQIRSWVDRQKTSFYPCSLKMLLTAEVSSK